METEETAAVDEVWKRHDLVQKFLTGVRGGIPYAADQIDIMLRVFSATNRPIHRFLDLGSGSGPLAAALLSRFPDAVAVLVDFSEPMLDVARQQFPSPPHVVIQVDFGQPGWIETVGQYAPFDAVVSGYAIHHQPDDRKRSLYAEILDHLALGAAFVNVEHVAPASPWVGRQNDELFIDSLSRHHQRIGSGKSREEIAAEYVYRPDKSANILASVDEQCRWLRDLGYVDVDCYFKVFELAVFGGRRPPDPSNFD
jgi:tRNA (cmo5U34)-methyltransferase